MSVLIAGCSTAPREATPPSTVSSIGIPSKPPTLVKVPYIQRYVSVHPAKEQLAHVGLVGVSPDVDYPHYFVRTRPKSGTTVEQGSTVWLLIGDG
jgi:hypothetical protein